MKRYNRWWLPILTVGLLCLPAGPLFAQIRGKGRGKPRRPAVSQRVSHKKKSRVKSSLPLIEVTSGYTQEFGVTSPVAEIKRRVDEIQLQREPLCSAVHATFKGIPKIALFHNQFSGSLFYTEYQGQKEVYGVIATHALTPLPTSFKKHLYANFSLHRKFKLEVYTKDGTWLSLPAEVVQLGAFGMGDVSLVKIMGEYDASKLHFFTLKTEELLPGDVVSSLGFIPGQLAYIPQREVLKRSAISVRTTLPGSEEGLRGICGGAGFDEQGNLVFVHTGSKPSFLMNPPRVGYGTYAWFLNKLVEAYHNNGEAYIPFELNGYHITDLRVDEYVSSLSYFNRNGELLWQMQVPGKFSFRKAQQKLLDLSPRSAEVVIGRMKWAGKKDAFVETIPEVRRVRYDFSARSQIPLGE